MNVSFSCFPVSAGAGSFTLGDSLRCSHVLKNIPLARELSLPAGHAEGASLMCVCDTWGGTSGWFSAACFEVCVSSGVTQGFC